MVTETPGPKALVGGVKGVKFTPPELVNPSIQASVDKILSTLSPTDTAALVGVWTPAGINAAFAVRAGEHLQVVSWIGTKGFDATDYGVFIKAKW